MWNGAATVLNNEIHYLGGSNGVSTPNFNTHYVYNSSTNLWTNALPLLHNRDNPVATTVNGFIYVIGGVDSVGGLVNWNEEYNPGICVTNITVTDTLLINALLTGINPATFVNTLKVYPYASLREKDRENHQLAGY